MKYITISSIKEVLHISAIFEAFGFLNMCLNFVASLNNCNYDQNSIWEINIFGKNIKPFESALPNSTTVGILFKVWDVKRSNSLKITTKMMQILLKTTPQSLCSNLNCLQKMLIKWVKMTSGLTMPKSYWMFSVRTKM